MTDSNDVLEHGDWRHAADVINMITKHAAIWRNGTCPLYVATSKGNHTYADPDAPVWSEASRLHPPRFPAWSVSPLRQVFRLPLPEMGWSSEDVLGGEGLVLIGDPSDVRELDFRKEAEREQG